MDIRSVGTTGSNRLVMERKDRKCEHLTILIQSSIQNGVKRKTGGLKSLLQSIIFKYECNEMHLGIQQLFVP